jgi:hypothetical protein
MELWLTPARAPGAGGSARQVPMEQALASSSQSTTTSTMASTGFIR